MVGRGRIIEHLRIEIAALESRLEARNDLVSALRRQLHDHESRRADERREQIYRRAAFELTQSAAQRGPDGPSAEVVETLSAALTTLGGRLDHKFAELRALAEVTERVNQGLFFDEVLDNVFDSFDALIPYDRIGVALIDGSGDNGPMVRSHWNRARYGTVQLGKTFGIPLGHTSLGTIIESRRPRIIGNLEDHLRLHPHSGATRLLVREGIRSSLTCPLVARGQVMGFIFFSSREVDAYGDRHVEIFAQIAGELALTLEKSRAYEELYLRNEFIKKAFGQYVTNEVAEMVMKSDGPLALGGDRRKVTVLMSDVRNFTGLSERLPPEKVVDTLNVFLGQMTRVIMRHGGSIDNFVGDAIVAVFGVPLAKPDDDARAVACAIEMQQAMAAVNAENEMRGLPALSIGIGLNTSEVVAGNIGSEMRIKYSVIGSPVNIAARLQSMASGGQVFAAESTYAEVRDRVRTAGSLRVKLKGVDDMVPVYEVTGLDGAEGAGRP